MIIAYITVGHVDTLKYEHLRYKYNTPDRLGRG